MESQMLHFWKPVASVLCLGIIVGCPTTKKRRDTPYVKQVGPVTVQEKTGYFDVLIHEEGQTPETIGKQLAYALQGSNWTEKFDEYLNVFLKQASKAYSCSKDDIFAEAWNRASQLFPHLTKAHQEELLAFSEAAADSSKSKFGDGKLSKDEILVINFFPEVARSVACSVFSAYGPLAEGGNRVGRVLDWPSSPQQDLSYINAVVTRTHQGGAKTVSVGYLGFLPGLTMLNHHGLFAALADCEYSMEYNANGKRSFCFDLRQAMEESSTISGVLSKLMHKTPSYPYEFNCLVADGQGSVVMENAAPGGQYAAAQRTTNSALAEGVAWKTPNAIAMVNSNVLKGRENNHLANPYNATRWQVFDEVMHESAQDGLVTWEELTALATNRTKGDNSICSKASQYITLWDAKAKKFQVWFRQPQDLPVPKHFTFQAVTLPW